MENSKFSYIVLYKEEGIEEIEKTVQSLLMQNQTEGSSPCEIIISNSSSKKILSQIKVADNEASIFEIHKSNAAHGELFNLAMDELTGDYVQFIHAGTVFGAGVQKRIEDFFEQDERMKVVALDRIKKPDAVRVVDHDCICDLNENPELIPVNFYLTVFRYESIKNKNFFDEKRYGQDLTFIWEVLRKHPIMGNMINVDITELKSDAGNYLKYTSAQNKEWYEDTIENVFLHYIQELKNRQKPITPFIQYGLFYEFLIRFRHNNSSRNKQLFKKPEEEIFPVLRKMLLEIDDHIIANAYKYVHFGMTELDIRFYMELKHQGQLHYTYAEYQGKPYIYINGIPFFDMSEQSVQFTSLNYEQKQYVLDVEVPVWGAKEDLKVIATLSGKELELIPTERYSDSRFFGVTVAKRQTYLVKIPCAQLKDKMNTLKFAGCYEKSTFDFKIATNRYSARLTDQYNGSYWVKADYLVGWNKTKTAIEFTKYTKFRHVLKELKFMKELFPSAKKAVIYRFEFWKNHSKNSKRNMWITFDKFYKGGDNGEYFYKYVRQQNDGVEPYYVVNENYPIAKRMKKEGITSLYFGSKKHVMTFLNSKVIVTTHANMPKLCGMSERLFPMLQDLIQGEVVCIQHGLSVQDLSNHMFQGYDNIKRYYFASKYEIDNIKKPIYGYNPEKAFRLTGLPRYDGLKSDDKKQILIIPTWRSYIALPSCVGNIRPYSDTFKTTEYYRVYNSLIHNKRLIQAAQKNGYKISYLVHPTMTSQIVDYETPEGVEILSPLNTSYEKVLREASLMITDFSGVQFDFAYMKKPILYYHPETLPAHYTDGGFDYDTMGFGSICATEDMLVDLMIPLIEKECRMEEKYIQRVEDFFAYTDHDNCKRIYEDILEYQSSIVHG